MKNAICSTIILFFTLQVFGQGIPQEYYSLSQKADSLFKVKDYKASSLNYSKAFKVLGWKGLPADRYSAACAWAKAGVPDSAIYNLERLVQKLGYSDYTKVSNEKYFVTLRRHKKWEPLVTRIKANADSILALEAKMNLTLVRRLDSLTTEDQKWRHLSTRYRNNQLPKDSISLEVIAYNLTKTDSLNSIETRKIFYRYGFPNYTLVGQQGSNNYWLLVQHQDRYPVFQDSVLQAMKLEAEQGRASWTNYAYLVDRVKVNTGKPQIYGTQMQLNGTSTSYEPKEVIEPEKLNERRKSAGLNTIEEYINTMNTHYFGTLRKK